MSVRDNPTNLPDYFSIAAELLKYLHWRPRGAWTEVSQVTDRFRSRERQVKSCK